jgi:hypothetical protein
MSNSEYQKCACLNCGGNIEFPSDRAGELVGCPHCGAQTELGSAPENPGALPTRKSVSVIGAVLLVLILVTVGELYYRLKTWQPMLEALVVTQAITNVFIPKAFQDFDGFKISKITLKKSEEGGLVYAFGIVKNDTNRQRFGVKVTLDLHDAQNAAIGSSSDYIAVLEPRQQWQFKALVTDPKAVSAVQVRIEEQK